MQRRGKLIVFTRFPDPGKVKTRLIPAIGAEAATAIHRRLTLRTIRTARSATKGPDWALEVWFDGGSSDAMQDWLGGRGEYRKQPAGDLGQRMLEAFQTGFEEGASAVVLIGTDCPDLNSELLFTAFSRLKQAPCVLGPAVDGGYYLIGLTRVVPELFKDIAWGTNQVLKQSRAVLWKAGIPVSLLECLEDVDTPADADRFQQRIAEEEKSTRRISAVIPVLNEEAFLLNTLESVFEGRPHEVIVVDGGSEDASCSIARNAGAQVITCRPGRAGQMNVGAVEASGDVLLFIHGDSVLPLGWPSCVLAALEDNGTVAGAFSFALRDRFAGAAMVEHFTNLRSRLFQMPYGDQGLFLRRSLFEELGGFPRLPIMEDYVFVRQLRKRGRVITLEAPVLTSGRRWQKFGPIRTTLINQLVITGYWLGVPPEKLKRLYRRDFGRVPGSKTDRGKPR